MFDLKYSRGGTLTWDALAETLVTDVCRDKVEARVRDRLTSFVTDRKFIPGGRYLYYAGRPVKYFNNCFLLRAEEDTREEWASLMQRVTSCLMTGGGIGVDYSIFRKSGEILSRTGGVASGPLPAMYMVNENGRNVMQGGSRRSAIYASLNWQHGDVDKFIHAKDWYNIPVAGTSRNVGELKEADFNYHAPLDHTNISVNYDNAWLTMYRETGQVGDTFRENCRQALMTGEPGFSFNFGDRENETLRNACCEVTSEDDSDVCNLGSINMAEIDSLDEFAEVVRLATMFLVCGTLVADLPYEKVYKVREKNRRLGLGLMGMHEWLLKRGSGYEVTEELKQWLQVYKDVSDATADTFCDLLGISRPVAKRAIAPTGSIGILAGTTTGVEPIYCPAYERRYLKNGKWHAQITVDDTARAVAAATGVDPDEIESAVSMANNPERRIKFQADVQDYVDQAISSTLNLPAWGSPENNDCRVDSFASILANYAHRIRGFTCYPDGARGGQPIVPMSYQEVKHRHGEEFVVEAVDVCEVTGHGGVCGG